MTIQVREVSDAERWDEFVSSSVYGHLLQSYQWGTLSEFLGGKVFRLGAFEEDVLVGTMQLAVNPVPAPLSHLRWLYCVRGPCMRELDAGIVRALVTHAHGIAQREHAVVLRLEPNIADDTLLLSQWVDVYQKLRFREYPYAVHGRRSWVLDIQPDIKVLFSHFKTTWRQNVRVAERKGVVVRQAVDDSDFRIYYDLLRATSKRDIFFIHSLEYHRAIYEAFSKTGDAILFLAEFEGQAIAAKMLIKYGNWCWDMFGATATQHRTLKPAYLLQYRCIQWAKEHACTHFDFRTIPEVLQPGEDMWGVYEYKQGFGGYSRLHMPTQDFVYRPFWYALWSATVKYRRLWRKARIRNKK